MLGVPTGLVQLNPGRPYRGLYLLAGPPGMGKTTMALQIATAATKDVPVVIATFEHAPANLTLKLLCARAGVNLRDVQRGYADPGSSAVPPRCGHPWDSGWPWWKGQPAHGGTRARPGTTGHVAAPGRALSRRGGLSAIMGQGCRGLRGNFRCASASTCWVACCELALGLHSPVLALASQNRSAGNYGNGKGSAALDSLKESGDLEYAADVVLFLTEAQERMATPQHGPWSSLSRRTATAIRGKSG